MSHMASLRTKLAILAPYLDDPDVTEIAINHPTWVWVGRVSQRAMYAVHVPELSYSLLSSLAELVASYTDQEIQRHTPILSATIPVHRQAGVPEAGRGCYRIQILLPPVVASHTVAMSIRKQFLRGMTLADYQDQGAFDTVNAAHQRSVQSQLCALYKTQQWSAFLRAAVVMHQNIVISAGTNAGKTTLLNTLLNEVPSTERIITIEDAREITLAHPNCLHLLYSRGGLGVGQVTPIDLLQAVLRLAPDRAIMGELRGEEAYAYLELLNSGHQGSMTTIHADSPERMFDRLAQMVMRFGSPLTKTQIVAYAQSLIHVVVQCQRDQDGRRFISHIRYVGCEADVWPDAEAHSANDPLGEF